MANSIKSDVFEIMQYEVKPGTKEKLNFDERNIVAGLNHKTIKEYAYIKHDKDTYTQKTMINSSKSIQKNRQDLKLEIRKCSLALRYQMQATNRCRNGCEMVRSA